MVALTVVTLARKNYRLRVTFADGLFVGTGGLDDPLRNFKTRPHLISRADGLTKPSPAGEGGSRACVADIFPLAEIADDG